MNHLLASVYRSRGGMHHPGDGAEKRLPVPRLTGRPPLTPTTSRPSHSRPDPRIAVTVRFPDDPGMVQAMYVARLSQGVLKDYKFIELMTSTDMVDALKRVPEFSTPVE